MNRKEVVIYLMDNPSGKVRFVKDFIGCNVKEQNVMYMKDGYLEVNNTRVKLYMENDKSEFEIVRELKQMSFVDAIRLIVNTDLYMKSVDSGATYYDNAEIKNFYRHEISGRWNVEGVYEDSQPAIDKWTPKRDEFFYYLDFAELNGYSGGNYEPNIDKHDSNRVEWGVIAKTKEEIIELRDKVSAFIGK